MGRKGRKKLTPSGQGRARGLWEGHESNYVARNDIQRRFDGGNF